MKYLLVLALLLLAGEAGAVEPSTICLTDNSPASEECRRQAALKHHEWVETPPDHAIPIPDGHYRGTFTEKNLDKLIAGEDPCLAQMEAAMRAMEPYLTRPKDMTEEQANEYFLGKVGALLQWGSVKSECWRTP